MKKILVSWSSGKDCAWALHKLKETHDVDVIGLLTTVTQVSERVTMHEVRKELLESQAARCGLPLWSISLPKPCSQEEYGKIMRGVIDAIQSQGITGIAFGDLFLEGIREYRSSRLLETGIAPLFPLWKIPTSQLSEEMIRGGLRAKLVSVDSKKLDPSFIGRDYDLGLLQELPKSVDPCGENGEFHTFVYDGPMFSQPIPVTLGETMERDGYYYQDLLLTAAAVHTS